ncbi:hypothetical protein [Streptomyces sp. SAS_275]|uniref:hypothetical protein n=1 Tax=Streptomyces sp. SAS_275 TaxID=3412746 RepID=UPI00403D1CAA
MSLLSKIARLFDRGSYAQPPVSPGEGRGAEAPANERPLTGPTGSTRGEGSRLKNPIARGAAEGTAREVVRKLFEEFLDS